MDKELLGHNDVGVLVLEAMDTERFTVMSHVWYALNMTKIKEGELLSFIVEVVAIHGLEEPDVEEGIGVQKAAYHSAKRRHITSKTSQKIPSKLSMDVVKEVADANQVARNKVLEHKFLCQARICLCHH